MYYIYLLNSSYCFISSKKKTGCWNMKNGDQTNTPHRRLPGRFGDYSCASPWSLLESATEAMKSRQGDNVEFVLWTG